MKPLLQIFLLFLSISSHAVPYINPEVAEDILARDYAGQKLYWSPVRLPLTIALTDNSRVANQLSHLFDRGMVERERLMSTEDVGNGRRKVVLKWRYTWPDNSSAGLAYGVRRVHSLMTMTDPIQRDATWYVEVALRWYVDDIEPWVADPALKSARPLRRAIESHEKPFEATVYLELRNNRWQIWTPE